MEVQWCIDHATVQSYENQSKTFELWLELEPKIQVTLQNESILVPCFLCPSFLHLHSGHLFRRRQPPEQASTPHPSCSPAFKVTGSSNAGNDGFVKKRIC